MIGQATRMTQRGRVELVSIDQPLAEVWHVSDRQLQLTWCVDATCRHSVPTQRADDK